jgi:hypothetical protein
VKQGLSTSKKLRRTSIEKTLSERGVASGVVVGLVVEVGREREIMNNQIARNGNNEPAKSLDERLAAMNAALERLGIAKPTPARPPGRLIVALDLTGSREASLKQARIATAAMFDAIKQVGAIQVQLVYYRGLLECRASKWHAAATEVTKPMLGLSCKAGRTQIARVLKMALKEKDVSGVVFVGDHCEENPDELIGLARKLGKPMFIFHECSDHDECSLEAKPVFQGMAEASGGVYVEFKPDSGEVLREVLSSVAAFSAAGREGVKQIMAAKTPEARQLQARLMLGPAGGDSEKRS